MKKSTIVMYATAIAQGAFLAQNGWLFTDYKYWMVTLTTVIYAISFALHNRKD